MGQGEYFRTNSFDMYDTLNARPKGGPQMKIVSLEVQRTIKCGIKKFHQRRTFFNLKIKLLIRNKWQFYIKAKILDLKMPGGENCEDTIS